MTRRVKKVQKKKKISKAKKRAFFDIDTAASLIRQVRADIIRSTTAAGSGHPSSSLSAADLLGVLFFSGIFRADIGNPDHPNNDRFILSKGHAAPLLYSVYAALGAVTSTELSTLRKFDSRLEGHPTMRFPYTEVPTGSLGQGLAVGVGMALYAQKVAKASYRTYVLLGDSEMMEGSNWEAATLAAHYKLNNLVAIVDINRLGQRGETVHGYDIDAYKKKFIAFGWHVICVDGHNIARIHTALLSAQKAKGKPVVILAQTIKGKGAPLLENKEGWHGKALSSAEAAKVLPLIGASETRLIFNLPKPALYTPPRTKISAPIELDNDYMDAFATRKAYGHSLVEQFPLHPSLVVLDAEVSNSTFADTFKKAHPNRFFEMFIAEQAMVSVALGFASRGALPCVSTFAAFFSRAFDQLRMAALSGKHIVCAGSHAGIAIGEDGASQMGLEDIALFRSLFGSTVLYPSDHVSEEKLAALALQKKEGVVYIRTTRGDAAPVYAPTMEFRIGGSHVVRGSQSDVCTIVAAGTTLIEALAAYDRLKKQGILVRVIDLYSIKPVDADGLKKAYTDTGMLMVVEDHYAEGGMSEAVRSAVPDARVISLAVRVLPRSGKPHELLAYAGIDRDSIENTVKKHIRI